METTDYVLEGVRRFLNIGDDDTVFDGEIIPHIMSTIGRLSQNGIGKSQVITPSTTWADIIEPEMIVDPEVFAMVPLYIMLSVKILFDPPPPSNVDYYASNIEENLWRLKFIYDMKKKEGI